MFLLINLFLVNYILFHSFSHTHVIALSYGVISNKDALDKVEDDKKPSDDNDSYEVSVIGRSRLVSHNNM